MVFSFKPLLQNQVGRPLLTSGCIESAFGHYLSYQIWQEQRSVSTAAQDNPEEPMKLGVVEVDGAHGLRTLRALHPLLDEDIEVVATLRTGDFKAALDAQQQ